MRLSVDLFAQFNYFHANSILQCPSKEAIVFQSVIAYSIIQSKILVLVIDFFMF
jgi:hypothetical protein